MRHLSVIAAGMVGLTVLARPAPGAEAPAPTVATNAANAGDLQAQRKFLQDHKLLGQAVFIEFGVVGCKLSGQGFDTMIFMDQKKLIKDVAFLRVEMGTATPEAAGHFAAKKPPFPVVYDPDASVAKSFAATVYPRFVLVDRFGNVRYRGKFPDDRLADYAAALHGEKADPGASVPLFGATELDVPLLLADTKLPDLNGAVKPLKDYRGAAGLMLMFVDTSCPFSEEAIRQVSDIAGRLSAQKAPTVLVNLDDPAKKVNEFFFERQTGTPVVYDETTSTKLKWAIDSVPTVVFIGADNAIVYNGPAVWAEVAAAAEKSIGLNPGSLVPKAKGTGFG